MARRPKKPSPFDLELSAEQRRTLGETFAREIDDALQARASVIATGGLIDLVDWYYEQGQSNPTDRPFPGAADLTSYFITENVAALRARLMEAIFGVRPFCFVEGRGADAQKAPYVEELTDWEVRKGDLRFELARTVHGALIEDCYILEVSERVETRKLVETLDVAVEMDAAGSGPLFVDGKPKLKMDGDEPVLAQNGETSAKVERTYTKTTRLGPQFDPISMKDFVFLPGHAKSRKDVFGYAYRIWPRLPELQERVADRIYDATAVAALGESSDREGADRPPSVDSIAPQYEDAREKELFQLSIRRDLDRDGREEWYVATVSLKTRDLLRLKLDRFAQKIGKPRCVPFVLLPRRNSVYGYSYGQMLLTLAEEHTALRNMRADRSALATNAPIKRLRGSLWNPDTQPFGVGAIIDVVESKEVELMQITDVPPSNIQQEAMLHQAKERVGGLSDSAVGVLSTERRTLGENRLVAGGSAVRVKEVIGHLHAAIAEVMAIAHAIRVESLEADGRGIDAPPSVTAALQGRGLDFSGTFTVDMLKGDFQFEPYGSDETADPERQRQEFDGFTVALANLAKVFPALASVLASPDAAKAVLEQGLRAYNIRDRQPFMQAFQAAPVMGSGGPAPMAPPRSGLPPTEGSSPIAAIMASLGGPRP